LKKRQLRRLGEKISKSEIKKKRVRPANQFASGHRGQSKRSELKKKSIYDQASRGRGPIVVGHGERRARFRNSVELLAPQYVNGNKPLARKGVSWVGGTLRRKVPSGKKKGNNRRGPSFLRPRSHPLTWVVVE